MLFKLFFASIESMIVRNSILLAFFSAISLLLAIFRDRMLATMVGVGPILDVYNAAFRVPDLLYGTLLAFVTAGTVVPFLTRENSHGNIIDPRQKLYSLTLFFGGTLSILVFILGIFLPMYAHYIVPGFSEDQTDKFIFASRLLLIQPFFLGLSSLISCFAQLRNEFVLYGIAPLGYSLSIILSIVFLYPIFGLNGLLLGVLMGSIVSFLIQVISLRGARVFDIKYNFSFHHVYELIRMAIPRTGTNVVTQFRTIFFTSLATTFGVGGLTSYLFAQRVTDAVTQIVQQSVTAASLPVLSKNYIEGKNSEYRKTVKIYTFLLGTFGFFASLLIFFTKEKVIWLLYGNTGFNSNISYFLNAFLILLPFSMMSAYLSISLYAKKDTKSVFISFLIATVISSIVGLIYKNEGEIALVLAIIVWAVSQFLLLFFFYSRNKSNNLISK